MADVDLAPGDSFNKKIRNAQLDQYNYILGECVAPVVFTSSIYQFPPNAYWGHGYHIHCRML